MRLKQIELCGFKSFPDRTAMRLENGITALVGPNGCGKSNIIDAVRWCMGETNARRLRGNVLEDLIFFGGEGLKPEGMAEVALTLSPDENGGFPPEYAGEEEITVRRRLFRDGTSEYSLNGMPCRLRDISEIFMDSGSGSRAYSLIEQGEVAALIEAKPQDRRAFLEQVAGIGKYRSRIQEATRRMEETRSNLDRVGDLIREIRRNLKILEVQAGRAEEGRKIREQVMGLGLSLDSETWRELEAELAQASRLVAETENREAEVAAELSQKESEESERSLALQSQAEEIERCLRRREEVLNRARGLETERTILTRDEEARVNGIARNREEIRIWREKQTLMEEEIQENAAARERLGQELENKGADLAAREGELAGLRERFGALERDQETRKAELIGLIGEDARLHNRETVITEKVRALQEKREKTAHEAQELVRELDQLALREEQCRESGEVEREDQERIGEARREHTVRLTENAGTGERIREEMARGEEELIAIRATLSTLGADRAGDAVPADGAVLRLEEVIEVDAGAEVAVEACLGEQLGACFVPDVSSGIAAARELDPDTSPREIFLPLRNGGGSGPAATADLAGRAVPLLSRVRVPEEYREPVEKLFREVYLVPGLEMAAEIVAENGRRITLVTPAGEVVFPSGEVRGGKMEIAASRLARRRRIRALEERREEVEREVAARRERLAEIEGEGTVLRAEVDRLTTALEERRIETARREKEIESFSTERSRLEHKQEILELEGSELEREIAANQAEIADAREQRSALARKKEILEQELSETQERITRLRPEFSALEEDLTARRVEVAALRERHNGLEGVLNQLSFRVQEMGREIEQREAAIAAAEEEGGRIRRRQEEIKGELGELAHHQEEAQRQVQSLEEEYQRALAVQREAKEKIKVLRQSRDEVQRRLQELRAGEARIRVELEGIATRVRERYGQEPGGEIRTPYDEVEREVREERLQELREKLDELGDVNPAALKEYEETKERYEFLNGQREDLNHSLLRLQRAIVRMNKTSRERLVQAFDIVNVSFRELFPRLFNGGQGELAWVGEDPLEAGVDIIARPPGKRPRSLSLLSGGEKALASVAFLISCYLAHPSPFCILDEVDAPLDEANIGRFNELIRELADRSQFILITHNRRTMEVADVLYGVTMDMPGVSKLISVRLN